jgi:hypothetical protein
MHNVTEEPSTTLSARPISVIITDRTNEDYTVQLESFRINTQEEGYDLQMAV